MKKREGIESRSVYFSQPFNSDNLLVIEFNKVFVIKKINEVCR